MGPKWTIAALAGSVVLAVVMFFGPSSGMREIAHESTRFHLGLFGSSIYEYHRITGNWPTQIGDLARTSLPAKSPYWKVMLNDEVDVIVWHKNLKSDPKENANHILVYHDKGLISQFGRSWVCWGDLRTEYIKTADLHEYLKNLKN